MKRSEKELSVQSLSEKLSKAKAVILAEYRGLKVSEVTEIRREIKKNAGDFRVFKNRLAKRAISGTAWAPLESHFKGPLALVISDQDPVILTKILAKYAETFAALKLKVGAFGEKAGVRVIDAKEIQAISKLPSKEELYAKFLGTLLAPASGLVRTLQGVPQKLVIVLKAIAEKKQ